MAEGERILPEKLYQEILSTLKETRTNNDKVLATIELLEKEIRYLSWTNVELKQRIVVLEGSKGNPEP